MDHVVGMSVVGGAERTRRRSARALAHGHAVAAMAVLPAAPLPPTGPVGQSGKLPAGITLPASMPLGTFAKPQGPWTTDWERARADAAFVLSNIDFSKRDIVIWVPGTDANSVHRDFQMAMRYLYQGKDVSLTYLRYEASWELRRSLPTGLATMKLVLEGIRQKLAMQGDAAKHRVLLSGESQGAWIIGAAAADKKVGQVITRAILVGHPWLATNHYDAGQDPRILELNHDADQIAMPVKGDLGVALDAMTAVKTGQFGNGGLMLAVKAIGTNPIHGLLLVQSMLSSVGMLKYFMHDPHYYSAEMPRMVNYLRTGRWDPTNKEVEQRNREIKQAKIDAAVRAYRERMGTSA